jgi:hypothetical protein
MAFGQSFFPALEALLDAVWGNVKGRSDPVFFEDREAIIDLARAGVVEGQADSRSLSLGPLKPCMMTRLFLGAIVLGCLYAG